jgi:hypothetical protein
MQGENTMLKNIPAKQIRNFILLTLAVLYQSIAQAELPSVPTFHAYFDVRINGITVANAEFKLEHKGNNEYLYEQNSRAVGIASWFKREKIRESSHWKLTNQGIQPIRYSYSRKGGSDDKEVDLLFDWEKNQVENRAKENPWSLEIPDGTLDKLGMQIAMLLDLQSGLDHFKYPIAKKGRIKHYEFKVVDNEEIELPTGKVDTIKLARLDDDRDQTYLWAAPSMEYIPVRFLKIKKNGLKYEIRLRKIVKYNGV